MSKQLKISICIILLTVSSVLQWCKLPISNTYVWWIAYAFCCFVFITTRPKGYSVGIITVFLAMVCLSALYGVLIQATCYWDYKSLVSNLFIFCLPLAAYTFSSPKALSFALNRYFLIAPLLFVLLGPFCDPDAFGRLLLPYAIITVFLPFLKKEYLIPIVIAYSFVLIFDYQSRSYLLKFAFCLLMGLSLLLYNSKKILVLLYRMAHVVLLAAPITLVILAAVGAFNIFDVGKTLGIEDKYMIADETSRTGEASVLSDTRSFIYVEEIQSALDHNYLIQGRSIARGYESTFFSKEMDEAYGNSRSERYGSEVSIMNIFNYFGLIGVAVYFILFIMASFFALYRSRNIFVKIAGVYVAFCWSFAWVEDFARMDLNTLFIWIMIGMCFSPMFRKMSDREFVSWIKHIRVIPAIIDDKEKCLQV